MAERSKTRTQAAIWLCVLMLAFCFLMTAYYLFHVYKHPESNAFSGSVLGIVLIDIPDEAAASFYHVDALGVYVLAVDEASQAYAAGVRSGVRVVSADGKQITSTTQISELMKQGEENVQFVFAGDDGVRTNVTLNLRSQQ